jgi:hypothetical protein
LTIICLCAEKDREQWSLAKKSQARSTNTAMKRDISAKLRTEALATVGVEAGG